LQEGVDRRGSYQSGESKYFDQYFAVLYFYEESLAPKNKTWASRCTADGDEMTKNKIK
jgi:hypothetical protein